MINQIWKMDRHCLVLSLDRPSIYRPMVSLSINRQKRRPLPPTKIHRPTETRPMGNLSSTIRDLCQNRHLSPKPSTSKLNPKLSRINPEKMADVDGIQHRTLKVNGINMHIAEKGEGPVILFLHGFPELWYSWRHQILALSKLGYHAVAPDMRGFGDTDAPTDTSKYTYGHIVGDLVALIDALGVDQVFLVGHDWGAVVAWQFAIYRPDRIKALVNMSVPFSPRNPKARPVDALRAALGDDYYVCRFQKPGEIEAEIAESGGPEKLLRKLFSYRTPAPLFLPKGELLKEPPPFPDWMSQEEAAYFLNKYQQTGFTGGLNYYRALNLNWEITAPWTGAQVKVPVKFVVGDLDLTIASPQVRDYLNKGGMQKSVPFLQDVVILEDVGHFIQQEKPQETNKHIHDFITKFN